MDRKEVAGDFTQALLAAIQGQQAQVWTALPGIVVDFDPAKMVVSVQPAIQALVRSQTGVETWVTLPLLLDCPVLFQGGGGCSLTFPIAAGDECLVIFGSRCIDAWWSQGTVGVQSELRMHDLSDGFALVGVRSQPKVIPSLSANSVQLRTDDGSAYIEVKQNHDVRIQTTANVEVTASQTTINGPVIINGHLQVNDSIDATGDVHGQGTSLHTHQHQVSGVDSGGSTVTSGGPL